MAQKIHQANIFGRIGSGIGQGLSEQIPKEIERYRLSQGLRELEGQQRLTPFQQFSRLASIPGITPQMIQSGSELLRQQGIAEGFRNTRRQGEKNPFRESLKSKNIPESSQQNAPGLQPRPSGLVSTESTQAALQNYIPRTREENISRAADLYDENKELYPNPESALQAAVQEDQQNQAISNALQTQGQSQLGVQNRVRGELQNLRNAANVEIPDNVFQQVENDVLDKIKSGEPELEAAKLGQKKLDAISREYRNLTNLGNWTFPFQNPSEATRAIKALREDFKERNDLENFADSLVSRNGLSFPKAYHEAYNIEDIPELRKSINKLPSIENTKTEDPSFETQKIIPQLAKLLGKEGSPLSIAEELRMKGYDPNLWLDYLTKNKRQLDLTERQVRELGKTRNWFPSMNDLWFFIGSGNDKMIED